MELLEKDSCDSLEEKEYFYWLSQGPRLGSVSIKKLMERYHSFKIIYNIEGKELKKCGILNETKAAVFDQWKSRWAEVMEDYHNLERKGIRFVSMIEESYPKRLIPLYGSPAGLYVKGRLPEDNRPSVAIVGARDCSNYGLQVAEYMGKEFSKAGIQVVSGMALGIDGAGHRGALKAGGDTYAVLGCGVDICYPRSHFSMYMEIPEKGGIISEYKLGEAPAARNFPLRNRIISGLSDAIVVVEAKEKSGSLITVDFGLEQGKEIYAVPGMIFSSLSCGCNQLIKQGAAIVTSPDDILEYFQIRADKKLRLHEKNEFGLAKNEKMVYACLDLQPKFIDEVVEASGLSLGECLTLLLELELKGMIIQPSNHYYAKKL